MSVKNLVSFILSRMLGVGSSSGSGSISFGSKLDLLVNPELWIRFFNRIGFGSGFSVGSDSDPVFQKNRIRIRSFNWIVF